MIELLKFFVNGGPMNLLIGVILVIQLRDPGIWRSNRPIAWFGMAGAILNLGLILILLYRAATCAIH